MTANHRSDTENALPPEMILAAAAADLENGKRSFAGIVHGSFRVARYTAAGLVFVLGWSWQAVGSTFKSLRGLIVDVLSLGAIVFVAIVGHAAINENESAIWIDIQPSPTLANDGLTSNSLSWRFKAAVDRNLAVLSAANRSIFQSSFDSLSVKEFPEIKVPESDLTISEIAAYVRKWLGRSEARISGQLAQLDHGRVQLTLRLNGTTETVFVPSLAELDELFDRAVFALMERVRPVVVAAILDAKGKQAEALRRARAIAMARARPTGFVDDIDFAVANDIWGRAFQARRHFGEAIEKYRTAARFAPNESWPLVHVAGAKWKQGHYKNAEQELTNAIEKIRSKHRPNKWAYYNRGNLRISQLHPRNYEGAIQDFHDAIQSDPNTPFPEAHLGLAVAYANRKGGSDAALVEQEYDQAGTVFDADLLTSLATALRDMSASRLSARVYCDLAKGYEEQDNQRLALRAYVAVASLHEDSVTELIDFARALHDSQPKLAATAFTRTVSIVQELARKAENQTAECHWAKLALDVYTSGGLPKGRPYNRLKTAAQSSCHPATASSR